MGFFGMSVARSAKLLGLLVTAFWVVMTSLLLIRHYGPAAPSSPGNAGELPEAFFGEQWFGVYQKDKRIGYSNWNFRRLGEGYEVQDTLKLRLRIMDATRDMEVKTSALLDRNLVLESFDLALGADLDLHVTGKVKANDLRLVISSAGIRTEKTIPLKVPPVLDLSLLPSVMKAGIRPGTRYHTTILDPTSLGLQPVSLVVEAGGQIQIMGRLHDTFKVKGSMGGGDFTLWVTAKGEVLKQESPLGFTMVRETKEEALRTETPSVDMAEAVSVPFNRALPEGTSYLKVRISGIDVNGLDMHGGRQTLQGDILEIRREEDMDRDNPRPRDSEVSPKYLADGVFIQTKDSRIISLSKKITQAEMNPLRMTERINTWVYRNIRKAPVISVPLSLAVLQAARGDCNEHAVLFASLARAAGIPTRVALGLLHQEGRFYYHAWSEVFVGRWIAVDPTLGQFPADAGHIRLLAGDLDKQAAVAGLIGKIRLHGLDFR